MEQESKNKNKVYTDTVILLKLKIKIIIRNSNEDPDQSGNNVVRSSSTLYCIMVCCSYPNRENNMTVCRPHHQSHLSGNRQLREAVIHLLWRRCFNSVPSLPSMGECV